MRVSRLRSWFLLPLHFHVVSEQENPLYDQENAYDDCEDWWKDYGDDSEDDAYYGEHWFGHRQSYSFQLSLDYFCQEFTHLVLTGLLQISSYLRRSNAVL